MKKWALVFSLVSLMGGVGAAYADVTVSDAWIRALPPGQPVTAAYLTLTNSSDTPIQIKSAYSDIAERVELHTHLMEEGMMKMRQVEAVEVPSKGNVEFKPGSFHVMLFGLTDDLKMGKKYTFTLVDADKSEYVVTAVVKKQTDHHHHH